MKNIYNNYEDKNVEYVYEIIFVGDRDLFWTGDGISSTEFAAIRYKDKQVAIDIARRLKEINQLQWNKDITIAIGTINVAKNLYINEEEVK